MYSTSQFDGNAAFSGGGFMPSQATQAATSDLAFSSARNRDSQTLLPLTVKQISEAIFSSEDKSNFMIDGVEVSNVTIVGMLLNKTERVTDVSFAIDDGTGRIDCHRWVNEPADTKEVESILEGIYVRVHGNLKGFQGKRHFSAFSVRAVTDFNEVTNHLIECMYVHLYNTKLRNAQPGFSTTAQFQQTGNAPLADYHQASHYSSAGTGLKGVDQMVLDYLQRPSSLGREKGVHREEIAQQLNLPMPRIIESISSLEDEGLVYSTIDDCHYKSTGNG